MRPGGRGKGLGATHLARLEEEAHAHRPAIGLLRGDRLAELAARLAPDAILGAGEGGQDAIARAVGVERCLDGVPRLGGPLPAAHARHPRAVHRGVVARAVQEEGDVGLQAHLFVEEHVPEGIVLHRVAADVVQLDLLDEPRLPVVRPVGAAEPHADLGRGVAPQDGSIVHEGHTSPPARRGDRRAHPGEPAPDDTEIHLMRHVAHASPSVLRAWGGRPPTPSGRGGPPNRSSGRDPPATGDPPPTAPPAAARRTPAG